MKITKKQLIKIIKEETVALMEILDASLHAYALSAGNDYGLDIQEEDMEEAVLKPNPYEDDPEAADVGAREVGAYERYSKMASKLPKLPVKSGPEKIRRAPSKGSELDPDIDAWIDKLLKSLDERAPVAGQK